MSTNNNRLGKEIKPIWRDESASRQRILNLSGVKLQSLLATCNLAECTAATLSGRGIARIDDLLGFSERLHRIDLSENMITRLNGFSTVPAISMLNVSSNKLQGDGSLEDLRYLTELRTLNIGNNPAIKHIRSHILKPLNKLQVLIAHECGLEKVAFLKFLPNLNTLVLSKNVIRDFSPREVGSLSFLTKLSLGHNLLETVPDLSSCSHLIELRLNHNFLQTVDDSFVTHVPKLKTLDLSHNQIADWDHVRTLARLGHLTNLSLKGNKLPTPPESADEIELREDKAAESIEDANERRYRHYVLSIFQKHVGAAKKLFVQLIVLDMKRVKTKWRPGMSSNSNVVMKRTEHSGGVIDVDALNAAAESSVERTQAGLSNDKKAADLSRYRKIQETSGTQREGIRPNKLDTDSRRTSKESTGVLGEKGIKGGAAEATKGTDMKSDTGRTSKKHPKVVEKKNMDSKGGSADNLVSLPAKIEVRGASLGVLDGSCEETFSVHEEVVEGKANKEASHKRKDREERKHLNSSILAGADPSVVPSRKKSAAVSVLPQVVGSGVLSVILHDKTDEKIKTQKKKSDPSTESNTKGSMGLVSAGNKKQKRSNLSDPADKTATKSDDIAALLAGPALQTVGTGGGSGWDW